MNASFPSSQIIECSRSQLLIFSFLSILSLCNLTQSPGFKYINMLMSPQVMSSASTSSLSSYPCGNSTCPLGCLFLISSPFCPQAWFFPTLYPLLLMTPPSTYWLQNPKHIILDFFLTSNNQSRAISTRFNHKTHPEMDHFFPPLCHYSSSSLLHPFLRQLHKSLYPSPCYYFCPHMVYSPHSSQRYLHKMLHYIKSLPRLQPSQCALYKD